MLGFPTLSSIKQRIKKMSVIEWILVVLLLGGGFLRLWNFRNTLEFLGDQGRDVIVASRIFRDHDLVLIGPVTSTGDMYLGPLYYYFMVPFLFLSFPNPIGPAYAVAALSILTIFLMYQLGKEIVGQKAAILGAFFFAFSSVAVRFARFSWNPNPAPLLSIIFIWALCRARLKSHWYFVLAAACIAILIQLHYVALLTVPMAGLVWLAEAFKLRQKASMAKRFLAATLVSLLLFVASLAPLIAFDIRHDYLNFNSLKSFIADSQDPLEAQSISEKIATTLKETHGRSLHIFFEVSIGKQRTLNTVLLIGVLAALVIMLTKKKNEWRDGLRLLFLIYVVSVLGLSFYRGSVFDHYISFLFPATFLIFGSVLTWISQHKLGKLLAIILIGIFLGWNIPRYPLRTLGWTVDEMQQTSQTVLDRVKPGEKYNVILLSESKDIYGQNYQYFLHASDKPPVRLEQLGEASKLFIIDEQRLPIDVTQMPIYEIVVFPNKKPTEVYTIQDGPRITVLKKEDD